MLSATVKQKHMNSALLSHSSLAIPPSSNGATSIQSTSTSTPHNSEPHRIAPYRTVKLHVLNRYVLSGAMYMYACASSCVHTRVHLQQVGKGGNASKRRLPIQYFDNLIHVLCISEQNYTFSKVVNFRSGCSLEVCDSVQILHFVEVLESREYETNDCLD